MAKKRSSLDALKEGSNINAAAIKKASDKINLNSTIAQTNNSTNKAFKAIRIDKNLHLQFKTYTASIGESMTTVIERLIVEYLNDSK